ncbi:MAG: TauD/TfdA family dioxygenase [Chitinophagaceae bacterium]
MNTNSTMKETQLPAVIKLDDLSPNDFIAYYTKNIDFLKKKLERTGIIKFKGVVIDSVESFQKIVDSVSSKFLNYIDGNSPRTKLSGHVYTSTEYDKSQRITMHNELSYSAKWPNKLFFSCLLPAEEGGETLIADSREILNKMDDEIVSEIERKAITYIRNLHAGRGVGPSWQETFETDNKTQLESYCHEYSIDYEWGPKNSLKIKQGSPGIIQHRSTGERLWFNQIDQFHPLQLGQEVFETFKMMYDSVEDFPMYVRFGDGTEITESFIQQVLKTIDEVTLAPVWEKNELMILDNELVSHGRNWYTGERKVVVAMSE